MTMGKAGTPAVGAGQILAMITSGQARTRSAIGQVTGLSRSTVAQRLDALFSAGLIMEGTELHSSGGRPARELVFNPAVGIAVAVDIGEDHTRAAVTDLSPRVLAERTAELDIRSGPEAVIDAIDKLAQQLLAEIGRTADEIVGIGLSVPAPVDFEAAKPVGPSVMTGWDDVDIRAKFARSYDAPVLVDNDVNVLTLAEHRLIRPTVDHLMFIKAGQGIGCGFVMSGEIYRGAQGAAGDIGHIHLAGHGDPPCRCGNVGCVEALAAGWSLSQRLQNLGFAAGHARDVATLVRAGRPEAIRTVRDAGRYLGEAVAHAASLLNPRYIVVGGTLASADDYLLAGVREAVYQRSLPLATRRLSITSSGLSDNGGVLGAAQMVVDDFLRPQNVDQRLDTA